MIINGEEAEVPIYRCRSAGLDRGISSTLEPKRLERPDWHVWPWVCTVWHLCHAVFSSLPGRVDCPHPNIRVGHVPAGQAEDIPPIDVMFKDSVP